MMKKTSINKKKRGLILTVICVIAFVGAMAIEHRARELYAVLAGIVVSGILWAVTDDIFKKKTALHSTLLYYVSVVGLVALGFLAYAILASFPPMSPLGVKSLLSILASIAAVLPYLFIGKLMKVNIFPWKRKDDKNLISFDDN